MSKNDGKKECLREAKDLLEKLNSWRDESHRQISSIITSHSGNINNGIKGLVEEVCDLKSEVSVLRKERTVLLETVDNLNGEIRHLNDKLQLLPILEDELNQDVPEAENLEVEISEVTENYKEGPRISNKYEDQERNTEYVDVQDGNGAIQKLNKSTLSNVDSENHSTIKGTADEDVDSVAKVTMDGEETEQNFSKCRSTNLSLDTTVCPECKFVFSNNENLKIHMENVHPKSELLADPETNEDSNQGNDQQKSESAAMDGFKIADELMSKSTKGSKRGKHKCERCPYQSNNSAHLIRHIKAVHDKIRKHVCEDCGYAASRKGTLNRHKKTVHKMGEKKFK